MSEKRPDWYSSEYRSKWDWETNKSIVLHEKPLRCPYCGYDMNFVTWSGYEVHSSDWYWVCRECNLRLPNRKEFSQSFLDMARMGYREQLQKKLVETKSKLKNLRNLYKKYGSHFTPEEKTKYLVETIEKQGSKEAV